MGGHVWLFWAQETGPGLWPNELGDLLVTIVKSSLQVLFVSAVLKLFWIYTFPQCQKLNKSKGHLHVAQG